MIQVRQCLVTFLFLCVMQVGYLRASDVSSIRNEYCRVRVRMFQLMATAYVDRPDTVYYEALKLMPILKDNEQHSLYFSVWSIYIQELYYNERWLTAQNQLRKMFEEIRTVKDPEANAEVYNTKGMLQLRFGEYRAAEKTLLQGLRICPPAEKCTYPRNRLILYRWLASTYLIGKYNISKVLRLCDEQDKIYRQIIRQQRGDQYNRDAVEIKAQRASALVMLGRLTEARDLLDRCDVLMDKMIPPLLYLQYYQALIAYTAAIGQTDEAIMYCDMLIYHFNHGYRPLQRNYMLVKADLQIRAHRDSAAASTYHDYVALSDTLNHIRVANDINELEMQNNVYLLQLRNGRTRASLYLLLFAIVFMLIIGALLIRSYYLTRRQNRVLVDRLDDIFLFLTPDETVTKNHKNELIKRLKEYVEDENRDELSFIPSRMASYLGVSVSELEDAVLEGAKRSLSEYVMICRLERARNMLIYNLNLTIQEIAFKCGYNTLRTFQRQFGYTYGMSPTQYRQNLIEKTKGLQMKK